MSKKNKKIQMDEETRKKSIDALKKKNIEIKDEDKISGGAQDFPAWLETPYREQDK